jgi:Secretion system C-terminal sorting domain
MKKICLAFMLMCFAGLVKAQTFFKSVGTDSIDLVSSILQTADGGYLLTGATGYTAAGDIDAVVMRLDVMGNALWTNAYGKSEFDQLTNGVPTFDGNYVCSGSATDSGSYGRDILLMKINDSGTVLWSKRYGTTGTDFGSITQSLVQTTDSGFALAGFTDNATGLFNNDPFIMRLNKDGDTLWTRLLHGDYNDAFAGLQQTSDGGFIACGRSNSFNNLVMDAVLVKFDLLGNIEWQKRYGSTAWEEAKSVTIATDGGYVVAGSTISFGAGDYDAMVFKTDTAGNILWSTAIGGSGIDAMYGIDQTADSGFVVTGFTESYNAHRLAYPNSILGADSAEVFSFKLNSTGDTVWCRGYGGAMLDESYSVSIANDGRIMLTAQSFSFGDMLQGLIIVTDETGEVGCNSQRIYPTVSACPISVDSIAFTVYIGFNVDTIALVTTPVLFNDSTDCFLFTNTNNVLDKNIVQVFPNPANTQLQISAFDKNLNFNLNVYDVIGKEILTKQNCTDVTTVQTSKWTTGIYTVKIAQNKTQQFFKLVITH